MTIQKYVPALELLQSVRAAIDADTGNVIGFIDKLGQPINLSFADPTTGQLPLYGGGMTAFRSDTLPVNSVAPSITGDTDDEVDVDVELTCDEGTWSGADNVYTFQWQRNGVNIDGATEATYTPVLADASTSDPEAVNVVSCVVTATNPAGAVSESSEEITVLEPA